jgi:hypothetical protein
MIALAAAMLLALPQDESKLREAWPKLAEAWKAIETFQTSSAAESGDEFLKAAGKLHGAFEAAGLYATEGEYVPLALKAFIKSRARGWFSGGAYSSTRRYQLSFDGMSGDPMKAFLDSLSRLQALEKNRLDDEDNVQDELATARKALKALGVTADATPGPLRRRILALARALALGEAYPEPAKATDEQAKAIRDLISGMSRESIEEREKAARELSRIGEAAFPFLRETLKSPDAEVAARSRQMLGIGHAPWTTAPGAIALDDKARFVEDMKLNEEKVKAMRDALNKKLAEDADRAKKR